jgi:putative DNA methylase
VILLVGTSTPLLPPAKAPPVSRSGHVAALAAATIYKCTMLDLKTKSNGLFRMTACGSNPDSQRSCLRQSLKVVFPDSFSVLVTPKSEELVASPNRHGGREAAEQFFLDGMRNAIRSLADQVDPAFPATIYYAFKQSEVKEEGISPTGWATFLQAVIEAGYAVVGTWPMRTEMANRMIASGTNALANSVVLVCRKKAGSAEIITRAEFVRALKRELPPAIADLQAANIAPADMPQSAIGPGMGVFSRYKAVLESDDTNL